MKEGMAERLSQQKAAFELTKKALSDPSKLEAIKAGIARYTNNVDVEVAGIEEVLSSEDTSIFDKNRGAAYMLWGAFDSMLQRGKLINLDTMTNDELSEVVYQTYSSSGASGV